MQIQNKNLANCSIGLRYARGPSGEAVEVKGNAEGIFEMNEQDARFLAATKGWSYVRKARQLAPTLTAAEKAAELAASKAANEAGEIELAKDIAKAAAAKEADKEEESEDLTAEDIEKIRSKAEVLELAKLNKIEMSEDLKLAEMKEQLIAALSQEESN